MSYQDREISPRSSPPSSFPIAESPAPSPETAELEPYMRIAMSEAYTRVPTELFQRSAALPALTLRKEVVNTIIGFGGTFNPPHIGHKLLLTHAFFRSSLPNVIAAFVLPDRTSNVANKLARLGVPEGLAFSASEREMLWHDDLLAPCMWVDQHQGLSFFEWEESLIREAGKDGFRLQVISLLGVEYLEKLSFYQDQGSRYPNTIYCDAMRPLTYQTVSGAPMQLPGYGPWRRRHLGKSGCSSVLRQAAIAERDFDVPWEREQHALIVLRVFLHESDGSWLARNDRDPFNNTIRFVPARRTLFAQGMPDLSSTLIREIMRTIPYGRELESQAIAALTGKAMNPALLLSMLRYNAWAAKADSSG